MQSKGIQELYDFCNNIATLPENERNVLDLQNILRANESELPDVVIKLGDNRSVMLNMNPAAKVLLAKKWRFFEMIVEKAPYYMIARSVETRCKRQIAITPLDVGILMEDISMLQAILYHTVFVSYAIQEPDLYKATIRNSLEFAREWSSKCENTTINTIINLLQESETKCNTK